VLPSSAGEQSAYSFRHALLQEAIYDDLLPRDRRRIHAEYARVLAATQPPSGAAGASHLAALAHHAEAAHQLPQALTAWVRAARAAYRVHAVAEAAHAYGRCLELWDAVPDDDRPRDADLVDLLYEASFALNGAGELSRSRAMADRAVQLEGGRDPERAALLLERLGRTEWLDGDLLSATATLERAVELIAEAPASAASARVVGGLAAVLMLRGRSRRAVAEGNRALQLARAAGSKDAEAFVLNTLGASLADLGRCSEAMHHGRMGMQLAIELDRADEIHRAFANLSTALDLCGRADEAIAMALEGIEWANRNRYRLQGAFLEGNAANILFQHGRWADAERLLHGDDRADVGGVATINKALTAGPLAIHTGRLDDARRVLRDARERVARLRDAQFTGPIMVALVELALIENRPVDAEALVEEALDLMTETEDVRYRAELMGLAVRAAFARAAAATAARDHDGAERARRSANRWMDRLADHVRAPDSETGLTQREAEASLAQAEAERSTAGPEPSAHAWEVAAAGWDAVDRPYAAAWCRYRQAEVLVTGNGRTAAAAVLEEAYRAAVRIGATMLQRDIERLASLARLGLDVHDGATPTGDDDEGGATPPVEQAAAASSSRPYDLTDRELQILPFLAAGLTNRQIGQAMFISPSTAGVHVSRILSKMGVSSRVEAAALAVRAGIVE
jgi:DNA-binding CsgD family transcriptional regulator/tetratricopeptide (TPR) repeat protein